MSKLTDAINERINNSTARSAWDKGVRAYAQELFGRVCEDIGSGFVDEEHLHSPLIVKKILLNGAMDWREYSYSGSSLIYDGDIAERLCTASELKRTDNGRKDPFKNKSWLDIQALALRQAAELTERSIRKAIKEEA